jgi:ABC-type transport system involved in cytochrome bd biosynthesis fused ATPase/permease subunit
VPSGRLSLLGKDLSVAPAPGVPALLDEIELNLKSGHRIAIVGPSGCGKSTLLATVLRQLPARAGRLTLVGALDASIALSEVSSGDVPPAIAGSLQGDHVFDATLRDNLRVVRPSATDADLGMVARRVGLDAFVSSLPQGWSTSAGADGSALSGGQRQRLLLARALLADPAILVLDEPTAHLDTQTERAVLADLLDATAGRTVLLSTHRKLPLSKVDDVIEVVGPRQHGCSTLLGLQRLRMC